MGSSSSSASEPDGADEAERFQSSGRAAIRDVRSASRSPLLKRVRRRGGPAYQRMHNRDGQQQQQEEKMGNEEFRRLGRIAVTVLRHERLQGGGPRVVKMPASGFIEIGELSNITHISIQVLVEIANKDVDVYGVKRFILEQRGAVTYIAAARKQSFK